MTTTATTPAAVHGSDYAVISRRIKLAGLLDRRPGYYTAKVALTLSAYLAVWGVFFWLGNSWFQMLVAVAMGMAFTQVAFLGHDAGHRQVFATRRHNAALGLVAGDLLVGLSYGWWIDKHTRHHAHPNTEDADPDIHDGALAFTSGQAARRRTVLGRALARSQAWLFFPMLTLEGINLHVASVRALLTGPARRSRVLESALLAIHIVGFLGLLFTLLSPMHALLFLAIQQGAFGFYMGCSFAPNHKGMPTLSREDDLDFLRRQVLTARNVRGGVMVDLLLGGLNYQIEHHLFPSMPRPNLRRAKPIIEAYCKELQLPYVETGLVASYVLVLRHLHDVAAPLRPRRVASNQLG
ncbi:MAG TPA: acyl-CoA desaturase [Jatrophihabitans sp.]|jgi:fatty acid desaturase